MTVRALQAPVIASAATARTRRLAPAGGLAQPSLRDEVRLVLSVAGAAALFFLPAAALIVGGLSHDLIVFTLRATAGWLITVSLQVALLRALRGSKLGHRVSLSTQFIVLAIEGVALKIVFVTVVQHPMSQRLGIEGDIAGITAAWTAVLVAAYLVWEREGRVRHRLAAQRLFAVQQAQLTARRDVVDAQLRAVQARVDPPFFFAALDAIEALYRRDAGRAEAAMEELIVFLRTALPTLDGASTVLARELDLAAACVRVHTITSGHECTLEIDVADALRRRAFPAGVLLPLVRSALDAAAGPTGLRIGAHEFNGVTSGESSLRLVLEARAAPSADVCSSVRDSLHALFGTSATLAYAPAAADRFDIVLELADDEA